MPSPIEVIINAGSGSVEGEEIKRRLAELFKENGVEAKINLAKDGEETVELAQRSAKSEAATIVAAGGDGTIGAVAAEAMNAKKTLGVLPLGTLNNFSKDLQIPQNLEEAVRVIAENRTKEIDVAEVNGRVFVNNSSIGLYPRMVRRRERRQRLGWGKMALGALGGVENFEALAFFAVRLETENDKRVVKTPFVFVGNNAYEMDFFNIGRRARLDEGKLHVYFLHRSGRKGLFLLALRTLFGRLRQTKDFEEMSAEKITIETRKASVLVAFDGEIETLETPLVYKIRPRALRVIAPKGDVKSES